MKGAVVSVVLSGNLNLTMKGDHAYLVLNEDERVLSIKYNEVSSMSSKPSKVAEVAAKMKKIQSTCPYLLAVISSKDSSRQNVAQLSNFKAVKKAGKTVLKMNISSDDLEAKGAYAKKSVEWIPLDNEDVAILCISSC